MDVTVVIPIYNVEKYLKQCLDSVLNQRFTNMEIICVNDCSTDASEDILSRYALDDKRIKIIGHSVHQGVAAARNTGLRHARGKYVYFLDSDDMILPETIEELFYKAEENELDIVYFNYTYLYENGFGKSRRQISKEYKTYEDVYDGKSMFACFWADKIIKAEVWRQFYRTDFLKENNIWFYEGILHEDNLFSFYCAMEAKRVMDVNKSFYVYRQHPNSIMSTMNVLRAESAFVVMMQIYIYWNTHVLAETIEKAVAEYIRTLFYNFQYCYHCCEDKVSLSVGSHADKCLYSLLFSGEKRYVALTEEKIEEIRGAAHVIIYGAGRAADETIQILTEHGIHIDGLAVSEEKENSLHLRGIEVRNIAEFIEYKNDAAVIVGVTKKYSDEMRAKLCEMGFQHIVMLDDCDI